MKPKYSFWPKRFFAAKKITAFIMVAILSCSVLICKAETVDNKPYINYMYGDLSDSKKAIVTKAVYAPEKVIFAKDIGLSSFNELKGVYTFENMLYILDSGNGRIVKLDKDYNVIEIISKIKNGNEILDFTGAQGIFVDETGLYIADTQNKRVICCLKSGAVKIIVRPDSTIIPEDYNFAPIKFIRNRNGYYYLLCEGSYYGLMAFSSKFEFMGFFGASTVKSTVFSAIKSLVTSVFMTEEKQAATLQKLPYQISDACIDRNGFISTVNSEKTGQWRVLGLNGKNTLKYMSADADDLNFGDNPISYPDKTAKYQGEVRQKFVAVTSDNKGFTYLLDGVRGKIFMYDEKCNNIAVFGGKSDNGECGTFVTPSSIACFGNDIVVSDYVNQNFTVFSLTDFGNNIVIAQELTNKGQHLKAKENWEKVVAADAAYPLSYRSLSRVAYNNGDYSESLKLSKLGSDYTTYALAFKSVRTGFFKDNFVWIFITVVALITAFIWLLIYLKNYEVVLIKNAKLRTAVTAFYHPFNSFNAIREKGLGSIIIATVFLFIFYAIRITATLEAGYLYNGVDTENFNAIFIFLGTVGIVFLWTVINWAVSVLFDGKGRYKDIYCATCYSLSPLIIYYFIFLILSHTSVPSANSGLETLWTICVLLTAILLLISMTVLHDFSFFKSIGTAFLTVIGMGIAVFVIFIVLTLGQDAIAFIVSIVNEALMQ